MEAVGVGGGVRSLFILVVQAAFKALLGVLGSCLVFLPGVLCGLAAEAGMKSFAVRFERFIHADGVGFRLGTGYLCSGQGLVIGGIGWVLGLGMLACFVLCTIPLMRVISGLVGMVAGFGGFWKAMDSLRPPNMLLLSSVYNTRVADLSLTIAKLSDQAPMQPRASLEWKVVLRS